MKVSIIIPVYNAEKYLESCIKSAINQTHSDCEVIAVDDGSTDNSLKILELFPGIKIICKENGGTPTALNAGIKAMTGDWFKWLSADDILKENAVELLLHEAAKTKDSESCIFYSHYDIINNSGRVIDQFIEPNHNNLPYFERNVILLDQFYGNGITSLIHKSMFEKFGTFDEEIVFQEDYEFWLRCMMAGCRLHLVEKNLAQYRIHDEQLTQTKLDESLTHRNYIIDLTLDRLDKDQKSKYKKALAKYRRQKPLKIRVRRSIRDMMLTILPKKMYDKILRTYMDNKKT